MCGIAGVYHYASGQPVSQTELKALTEPLTHRGPDDAGYYVQGPIGLGHRRLSIIDLEGGRQPIFNEDRSVAVVFNGEIYNYELLRSELERQGHFFATNSDTEVIVHLYEQLGDSCLARLRGMFAVALWDSRTHHLLLGRDRLGKKPLYYFDDGRSLYFASELKSFFEVESFKPTIEPASCYDYLAYLCIPAPRTIFKNVFKVEPGAGLAADQGKLTQFRYWDLHFREDAALKERDVIERLDSLLNEAVKIRLMSDVPLGAFLSGGVDSSTVVALMRGLSQGPVIAASIGFDDVRFDESRYSRQVGQLFQCEHFLQTVDHNDLASIDELVWYYDEPFADPSALPTYQLCRKARQHMKVALSGDGSDEVMAGYRRYGTDLMEHKVRERLPDWLRHGIVRKAAQFYPSFDFLPRFLRAKTSLTNLSLTQQDAHFNSITYFKRQESDRVFSPRFRAHVNGYDPLSIMQRHYDQCDSQDTLNRMLYVDMKTYLPERMLAKVDRASMAHGLEVRNPFLDHKLIEFLATLPSDWKLRNGEGKYILKKLMEKQLPREILYRSKQGFDIPVDHWFRHELRSSFESLFKDPSTALFEYFDRSNLHQLWQEHISGIRDHGNKLWIFFIFDRWHRRFLG